MQLQVALLFTSNFQRHKLGLLQAAEGMTANGAYGLATYPWDLTAISNATPTQQKTSLIEVCPSSLCLQRPYCDSDSTLN